MGNSEDDNYTPLPWDENMIEEKQQTTMAPEMTE